jgi:predicted protein tyrosine phosphatase
MVDKIKVLTCCSKGLNRSKYLAEYLKRKGYSTKFGGVEGWKSERRKWNPISQEMVNWADVIISVRPRLVDVLKNKFRIGRKKIISLDVSDSKMLLPKKFYELKKLDFHTFNRKWTRPQLRKAIKPFLPLKK